MWANEVDGLGAPALNEIHLQRGTMRFSLPDTLLGLAFALASVGTPSCLEAQATNPPGTVVIAIVDNYPLFEQGPGRAAGAGSELRAILIPRDFVDESRSVILINPAYATPEVLYAALRALESSFSTQPQTRIVGITRRATPAANALPRATRQAMTTALADLLSAPSAKVRGHAYGRHIVRSTPVLGGSGL